MKFRTRMLMMMFVICSTVAAQTGAVSFKLKGVLLDSLTNDGEAYATVSPQRLFNVSIGAEYRF